MRSQQEQYGYYLTWFIRFIKNYRNSLTQIAYCDEHLYTSALKFSFFNIPVEKAHASDANIAIRAARKAGNHIAKNYEMPSNIKVTQKGTNDFVTNVDQESEQLIIEIIRKSYPDHTIITEESGELIGKDDDIQWVIDPLDGTTNFTKRLLIFLFLSLYALKYRSCCCLRPNA